MKFRELTWDKDIYRCVAIHNEYKLPNSLSKENVIIDIGAHIGSFSRTCIDRGAGTVVAFEAHPENFKIAVENVPEANIYNYAVWSTSNKVVSMPLNLPKVNTGGAGVIYNSIPGSYLIPTIDLDSIVEKFDTVNIVKMDCEGSEFEILTTFKNFHKVKLFVGEYHIHKNWTLDYLKDLFERNGFVFEYEEAKETSKLGHFWAK